MLVILAAVQFITVVDFMIVMPLGPQLMRALDIQPAEFGLIVSSYTFAAGVMGILAASIVDRFARRTTFMVLYAGFLLGTLLCALATSYHLLLFARVATGAFGGILGGMAMTIIGDVFPEGRRGRATGSLMTGFALASVAGVPLGLFLGTSYGWHVPFFTLVLVGLPVLGLIPLALPPLAGSYRPVARPSAAGDVGDVHRGQSSQCLCADHRADGRQLYGLSLRRPLPGGERRPDRAAASADLYCRRRADPDRGPDRGPAGRSVWQAENLSDDRARSRRC